MKIRQLIDVVHQRMSGEKVFFIKNEDRRRISVMAQVPADRPMRRKEDIDQVEVMAKRAKSAALNVAQRAGIVESSGVMMGGNGRDPVMATGFAELPYSQEAERRLESFGIHQIR